METWETTRRQRWIVALAISAIILTPVLIADTNYDAPATPPNPAPTLRGIFVRGTGSLAMTPPGGKIPSRCCSPLLNRESASLGTDQRTSQDLLLLLPVDVAQKVTDMRVDIAGENGLHVTTDAAPKLEPHTYFNDAGPSLPDGRHIVDGWIARVPVSMMPTKPWDIGGNRYGLNVTGTYFVGSESETRTFAARGAVEAQVASGIYEMGAAASILPLLCFGAAFRRWRRTR